MASGLLYITAVIVMIAIGFVFAIVMSRIAIQEADRGWPTTLPDEAAHTERAALVSTVEAVNVSAH
jgi:hypothetical protein